jgi:1-acyl-sn-glycerol-3-phosphate acyltransferase
MRRWRFTPARDHELSPTARLSAVRREPGLVSLAFHAVGLGLGRAYLALMHRFRVEGRENLPADAPFVMIANHASHLDALSLIAALPWRLGLRSYPLAAGDVFFNRLGRSILSSFFLNALPVWRKRPRPADIADLRARLCAERCVFILFPEGGRARDGLLHPFKPGVGMLVSGTTVPVVPCRIDGAHEALPPGRELPRRLPVRVRIAPPVTFEGDPNLKAGWLSTAARLEALVRAMGTSR